MSRCPDRRRRGTPVRDLGRSLPVVSIDTRQFSPFCGLDADRLDHDGAPRASCLRRRLALSADGGG